jgi:hypothetical protein
LERLKVDRHRRIRGLFGGGGLPPSEEPLIAMQGKICIGKQEVKTGNELTTSL